MVIASSDQLSTVVNIATCGCRSIAKFNRTCRNEKVVCRRLCAENCLRRRMLVTPSLASGAVREAARATSAAAKVLFNTLERKPFKAPETFRRYKVWFRRHRIIHEHCAVLIVFGTIGRRRGAFSAFMPVFEEDGVGWELEIRQLSLEFLPGDIELAAVRRLPVTISGHALERMFQRTGSIQWSTIRDCLAAAALLLNAAVAAYIAAGCKQCAIPAEKGLLVGQVVDGRLDLRTFLPELDLQPKWRKLLSDLSKFLVEHKQAVHTSALTSDDEAANALITLFSSERHKWLCEPYSPSVDPLNQAWRSKEATAGA